MHARNIAVRLVNRLRESLMTAADLKTMNRKWQYDSKDNVMEVDDMNFCRNFCLHLSLNEFRISDDIRGLQLPRYSSLPLKAFKLE
jgi:hypothetical protein